MNIGNIDMNGGYLGNEEVIKCCQGNTVVWEQSGSPIDYSTIPFTIKAKNSGTIQMIGNSGVGFYYLINNNGEWVYAEFTNGSTPPTFTLNEGDYIQFKGTNNNGVNNRRFTYSNGFQFDAYGNIMSLVNKDTYDTIYLTTVKSFENFFENSGVISAENLILPLVVGYGCYYDMFNGCTSLTTAPELPATTLVDYCYREMFRNCTSLTTGPSILPATTLTQFSYYNMFRGCSNLNYIKCLATNISARNCISDWVNGVAASGTFVTPSTTNWPSGISGIPNGWTRVNSD